jgi:outer membrane biosynthesis protein TonB
VQRSFVAKTTVNFPDFELYVRMGDILVFNAANDNSLTIYRGGAIVKTIRTTPISIAVLLKTKMIEETVALAPKPVRPAPPKPAAAPKPAPKPKAPPKPKPAPKPKEEPTVEPAPVVLPPKAVAAVKESLEAHVKGEPTLSTEEVLASIATPPAEEK